MTAETFAFEAGHFQYDVVHEDLIDDFEGWTGRSIVDGVMDKQAYARAAVEFEIQLNNPPVPTNNLLVRAGGRYVLIDVGNGKRPFPGYNEGKLLQNLTFMGVEREEIDEVVITHSDYDHIGGILDQDGQLEFPNARYYLSVNSWKYWSSDAGRRKIAALHNWPDERIDFVWGTYSAIRDRLTIVDYEVEFIPGFRLYPAPGHRYDHDVVKIESSDKPLIHLSDVMIHPIEMANRAWYYTFHVDPVLSIETKERMLKWCMDENALVFASHFPWPGLGTVKRPNAKWEWHPTRINS